jgi:hypothetical protein
MGIISKGILGGFSGTVGTVIGGTWKGITYMRSQPAKRASSSTPAQLEQQAKFATAMKFVNTMSGLFMISFRNYAVKMTGINNAFAYVLKNAVTGIYPAYTINYPTVLVSRGDLANVLAPTAIAAAGSLITFAWTDNSGVGIAKASDKAILAIYCAGMNLCIYTTGSAARGALTDTIDVSAFSGKAVETYIGFISEDGKNVASSLYTGQLTVS